MDDIVLIRKCLAGEREAFEPLVARYKNLVYGIALSIYITRMRRPMLPRRSF